MPRDQKQLQRNSRKTARYENALSGQTTGTPVVTFSMELPIHAKLDEIQVALNKHQVLVVSGETGSGKTTQLPKLCLAMGRGKEARIGHTQPRRIAAKAVANRIAEELKVLPGDVVGFKIRYTDTTSDNTRIKLMTDGILLSELQHDRQLFKYDTLIIDEAHERSLNIDFILGYLKHLLPQRPDLKLIVTSATIDVERFSEYFDQAPVIEVSGRMYPVEVRYRAFEQPVDNERDDDAELSALHEAVRELSQDGHGDMLIFLEGEREIHETARFLANQNLRDTDIMPLYSRLSSARQAKIFAPHKRRHIILATNIAETSLTIPGIRYVIDRGYARISRYSRRSKVQQLPVEKISQASAEQRKGRCGRVADGICIRLYSGEDYTTRPEFTEPEILRTNLASVILQMKALNLPDISDFPFINKPDPRFINDGLRLLTELKAINADVYLTQTGRQLARLPLDPRLGCMLLAASKLGCVSEVLIIVSALSAQDPRERPLDAQEKADAAHERFRDERSDFMTFLNIWQFYHAHVKQLTQNQIHKLCRQNFLSYVRIREWKEIHKQLIELLVELDIHGNTQPANYDVIHCALLPGLLSHIAVRTDDKEYTGARGIKLHIFPGSSQFTKLPKWIMAAELVETSRLYARTVAAINPQWLIKPAAHLLQREYFEPHWDSKIQQVMGYERVTLFGLLLFASQKINYGKINPQEARAIFIRHALVENNIHTRARFLKHNHNLIEEIKLLEQKSRRLDIYNEEALYDFYDNNIPEDIFNGPAFEKWYADASKKNETLLCVNKQHIIYHEAENVSAERFPDTLDIDRNPLPLNYKFEPDEIDDGVNIDIPLLILNQVSNYQLEGLVPGMLEEKITVMLRALPKNIRRNLVPIPETASECAANIKTGDKVLSVNLAEYLYRSRGIQIPNDAWQGVNIPDHLLFNIRIMDEDDHVLAQSRNLDELKNRFSKQLQNRFSVISSAGLNRDGMTRWDFDDLPAEIKIEINKMPVTVYPALVDRQDSVAIGSFDTREKAQLNMQSGLLRLFMLVLAKDFIYLGKNLPRLEEIKMYYSTVGKAENVKNELVNLIAKQAFLADDPDIRTRKEFEQRKNQGRKVLLTVANNICMLLGNILKNHNEINLRLIDKLLTAPANSIEDIKLHLTSLVYPEFLKNVPLTLLKHYPRYLNAVKKRLDKLDYASHKDEIQLNRLKPYWAAYIQIEETNRASDNTCPGLDAFRFMLEEYRVSLFAQELGTAISVSPERLQHQLGSIRKIPGSNPVKKTEKRV
jgi:ATP-dependent helicase HrpA